MCGQSPERIPGAEPVEQKNFTFVIRRFQGTAAAVYCPPARHHGDTDFSGADLNAFTEKVAVSGAVCPMTLTDHTLSEIPAYSVKRGSQTVAEEVFTYSHTPSDFYFSTKAIGYFRNLQSTVCVFLHCCRLNQLNVASISKNACQKSSTC